MAGKTAATRMTEGSIAGSLFAFTMPILLGNIFQQLYNTADALIVGNMLSSRALAAVTSVGSVTWMLIGFFNGFAQGSGVIIARYFGAGDEEGLKKAIHTHTALSFIGGLLLTALGVFLSPWIIGLMNTPAEVVDQSVLYLRVYFMGGLGLSMYNGCMGLMQAVGDSKHPLYYLIFSSCLNVVLDIVFIGVFKMDVDGAALATIISQFLSAALCLIRLFRTDEVYRLEMKRMRMDPAVLKNIFRLGTPTAVQSTITAFGNTLIQANINTFGDMAMAGVGALHKIEGFIFLPITSLSVALATFVSQNLGAREYERTKKGAKYGIFTGMIMAELMGLCLFLFAPRIMALFTREPEAIAYGVRRVQLVWVFYCCLAATHTQAGVMRGAGKPMVTMVAYVGCWCVLRVLIMTLLMPVYRSIDVVFLAFSSTWCISASYLAWNMLRGKWLQGKVIEE
ncbi:MAG: MATE family efflux transporter [Firmicutes bacterium]|nr:MATE family efflux transporter [Bacillota bacterium]